MSSIDVSSTAKVSPHHAAARDPPTPFAGDPSCQSRYRVDPVSCSLRISQNTKDSKATSGITGAQRHFVEDLTEKMLSRPWAVQNKCTLRSRDGSDGLSRLTAALLIASFPFEALARDSGGCRVSSINTHCGSQLSSSKSWSTFYRGKCWAMFACEASDTTVHSITKNCNVNEATNSFIIRRTLKKVNFRQTLPKHVQKLQSGAAVEQNGGCLFCVSSSADVQKVERKFFFFGKHDLLLWFLV